MTTANTPLKAFVLINDNKASEDQRDFPQRYKQFINLLTTCNISVSTQNILPAPELLDDFSLIFIDATVIADPDVIPTDIMALAGNHKVAIFNCQRDGVCEKVALLAGVQGVFYQEDRVDIMLKGIESLLADERWFKREIMNEAIEELLQNPNLLQQSEQLNVKDKFVFPTLTKREKTIIHLVSSGAQNKEIAEQLHISPNTVKTHIYSIFRKTSSRNRVELMSWTKKFQQLS